MSLFDAFATDDPKKAAYMAMAAGLLGGRGSFNQILGESMLGAQKSFQQARQAQQASEMNRQQLAQLQRQAQQQARQDELQALPMQFYKPPSMPAVDATGGMETAATNPANASGPGSFDQEGYLTALRGKDFMESLRQEQMLKKQAPELKSFAPGHVVGTNEGGTFKPSFTVPDKPEKPDKGTSDMQEFAYALSRGEVKPGQSFTEWMRANKKAGASSVSFGTGTTAVQMPDGSVQLVQLSGTPGVAPQVVKDPTTGKPLRPPPQDRDTKLPAELQRMQIAGDAMVTLMDTYEGMLKKHNPRDPMVQMNPTIRASMQSIKRNIELQFKELQALGALAGPDIEIMRQSLADPFSFSGAYFGKDGLLAQVKQAKDLVKIRADSVLKSQGRPASTASDSANDPLGLRK